MELISVGVALGVPLMQWCFVEHMTLKYFLLQWLFSFVYANCVGVPLCVAMPRTWDQPKRGPATLRWLVRAATLVSGTAAGCLIAGLVLWSVLGNEYHYWPDFVWSFRLALILAAVISLFFAAYERMQGQLRMRELELRTKELERERALKLATESQFLRASETLGFGVAVRFLARGESRDVVIFINRENCHFVEFPFHGVSVFTTFITLAAGRKQVNSAAFVRGDGNAMEGAHSHC
jgi:MFS family permease